MSIATLLSIDASVDIGTAPIPGPTSYDGVCNDGRIWLSALCLRPFLEMRLVAELLTVPKRGMV